MSSSSEWEVESLTDASWSGANWIDQHLVAFSDHLVTSLMPGIYESYCRVFHPAFTAYTPEGNGEVPVRWAEVASRVGSIFHAAADWRRLSKSQGRANDEWALEPFFGEMPLAESIRLATILNDNRTAGIHYFAFSASNNVVGQANEIQQPLKIGFDRYHVFAGDLLDIRKSIAGVRPDMWWPASQDWFVVSNRDQQSTYVGGQTAVINNVIRDRQLEALEVSGAHSVLGSADTKNG